MENSVQDKEASNKLSTIHIATVSSSVVDYYKRKQEMDHCFGKLK